MSMPPVVYVGPSLEPDVVRDLLPQVQIMPPIRRGDLYRDRLLGFRLFLILDGAFFQSLAISPREIIDVIQDQGIVVGASSMGAMRAAECWPAGMHGVGSIYRLFRRGRLTSDDEVAVAFVAAPPYLATTVPLVNVRYAVSRAARDGTLSMADARRIVASASDLHYSDRTWRSVIASAAIPDQGDSLLASLSVFDLKRMDAVCAVRRIHGWIEEAPYLLTDKSATRGRRFLAAGPREVPHDSPGTGQRRVRKKDLWRWLVATGRYRRYAAIALGGLIDAESRRVPRPLDPDWKQRATAASRTDNNWSPGFGLTAADVSAAVARRHVLVRAVDRLARHDSDLVRAVLAEVVVAGDLDAIVLRFRTFRSAVARAKARALRPEAQHRYRARQEIAAFHGFQTWPELRQAFAHSLEVWTWIEEIAEETALAKRVRDALFTTSEMPMKPPNL